MRKSKNDYLEDAALVIDGRIAALTAELKRDAAIDKNNPCLPQDRAAIGEARHLARLIRSLKQGNYRDPYKTAQEHWNHGRAADNLNR